MYVLALSPSPFLPSAHLVCTAAGDLNWFDPDSGETVVYNLGDMAWIITAMALVWIMIPGVGYFYSGLLRRKNALSMIFLGVAVLAVVSFQVRVSLIVHVVQS